MRKIAVLAPLALLALATAAHASGYPGKGRALDTLRPASDYSDVLKGRPLALGIMRTRGQGFVPSPELQAYVQGVMNRLLAGVNLPPSFQPQIRVLATPEFAGECTPDGTLIVTVGLLELLETEDELAFVLGHELAHAIYRHQQRDWFKKAQFYAVVNGSAVDFVAQGNVQISIGGNANLARGLDVAQHLAKLSANVLMPQMAKEDEDAADALGFDLMVKAGYDPEAPLAVMDKLAAQEAEAEAAADAAKQAAQKDGGGSKGGFMNVLGGGLSIAGQIASGGRPDSGQVADLAISVFDSAVDSMAEDATTHHPARERADLLSAYLFRAYRDAGPVAPTPLPWAPDSRSPLKPKLVAMFAHYTEAENAAAWIADPSQGSEKSAGAEVARAVSVPTVDHAYTDFVAAEYYEGRHQEPQSLAALKRAADGPEPSWEIYARLIDRYIAANDLVSAQAAMDRAVARFEDSPVLLPKRIQLLHLEQRDGEAKALIPRCKSYDIDELTAACKKEAG
ncbi:MAG: M48 family metalloprotease [Alphaproteobacteria bacterium]|nr:M48 family metalloprotease [Alphaproteobacteria bacterium]MBV9692545.1 M48 family metalloprotease [Alphaproteobacteria bacterium]